MQKVKKFFEKYFGIGATVNDSNTSAYEDYELMVAEEREDYKIE